MKYRMLEAGEIVDVSKGDEYRFTNHGEIMWSRVPALPIVIHAGDRINFGVGNQSFVLEYMPESIEASRWMADRLQEAFERAGATVERVEENPYEGWADDN